MKCIYCGSMDSKVVDSRQNEDGVAENVRCAESVLRLMKPLSPLPSWSSKKTVLVKRLI